MDEARDTSFVMWCCKIPSPSLFPTEPTHHNTHEQQNSLNLIYRKSNQTINGWDYIKKPFSGRLAPLSRIQLPDTWNVHQFSPTNAAAESPCVIFISEVEKRNFPHCIFWLSVQNCKCHFLWFAYSISQWHCEAPSKVKQSRNRVLLLS